MAAYMGLVFVGIVLQSIVHCSEARVLVRIVGSNNDGSGSNAINVAKRSSKNFNENSDQEAWYPAGRWGREAVTSKGRLRQDWYPGNRWGRRGSSEESGWHEVMGMWGKDGLENFDGLSSNSVEASNEEIPSRWGREQPGRWGREQNGRLGREQPGRWGRESVPGRWGREESPVRWEDQGPGRWGREEAQNRWGRQRIRGRWGREFEAGHMKDAREVRSNTLSSSKTGTYTKREATISSKDAKSNVKSHKMK